MVLVAGKPAKLIVGQGWHRDTTDSSRWLACDRQSVFGRASLEKGRNWARYAGMAVDNDFYAVHRNGTRVITEAVALANISVFDCKTAKHFTPYEIA